MIRRWGLTAAVLVVIMFGGSSAAWAADWIDNLVPNTNYGPTCYNATLATARDLCQTDNPGTSVWMQSSVSTNMRSRIRDALDNSFNPIDSISISYASSPVYDGGSETDIIYQQGSIPFSGVVGVTWCNDAVNGTAYKCDQTYIRFTTDTFYEHRALTCHETGHAFGLTHGQDAYPRISNTDSRLGCMVTPYDVDAYTLGSNNVHEINAVY